MSMANTVPSWLPNGGQLLWAPISKVSGEDAKKQHDVAKKLITEFGFDYLGAFAVGMRELRKYSIQPRIL